MGNFSPNTLILDVLVNLRWCITPPGRQQYEQLRRAICTALTWGRFVMYFANRLGPVRLQQRHITFDLLSNYYSHERRTRTLGVREGSAALEDAGFAQTHRAGKIA